MARKKSGHTASTRNAQPTLSFNYKSAKVTKPSAIDATGNKKKTENISPAVKRTQDTVEDEADQAIATETPTVNQIPVVDEAVKDEAEIEAEKIPDKALTRYWQAEEAKRKARRGMNSGQFHHRLVQFSRHTVHQDDLSMNEKILRHFDLSSQYGPCFGITRLKRWKRASNLGFRPPIEVLAVILKEEQKKNTKARQAYVDELVSGQHIID